MGWNYLKLCLKRSDILPVSQPSLLMGVRFKNPPKRENPRIIHRLPHPLHEQCFRISWFFYLLCRNAVMRAAPFFPSTLWTSCSMVRRPVRFFEQFWYSFSIERSEWRIFIPGSTLQICETAKSEEWVYRKRYWVCKYITGHHRNKVVWNNTARSRPAYRRVGVPSRTGRLLSAKH